MAEERRIDVCDVQVEGDRSVHPSGSKVVASYNWSSSSRSGKPRIIVPGTPRLYVEPGCREFSLGRDDGDRLTDENASRMHPFSAHEPLFHSLGICSPDLDLDTVDIVADRNNLRNILMFCGGPRDRTSCSTPDNFRSKPYRFLVHGIGEDREGGPTLVFTRISTGREEHYPGYGESFDEKLTEKDPRAPPDAGRFSAVVKMTLDGITLLVRSKVKACETDVATRSSLTLDTSDAEGDLCEQLQRKTQVGTSACSGKGSSPSSPKHPPTATSGLTSTKSGELLGDGARLLELKSKNRRHAHEINWFDFYSQMALGGTHKLVLGLHKRGTFLDGVQELTIDEVKGRADENGSSSMVYLANTLREVIKAAHCLMASPPSSSGGEGRNGHRPVVVVQFLPTRSGEGTLRIRLAVPADGPLAYGPFAHGAIAP